jgi:ribosome maturation factor RimP
VLLGIILIVAAFMVWRLLSVEVSRDNARDAAHLFIDQASSWCFPETDAEIREAMSTKLSEALDRSDLDYAERQTLEVAFENRLNQLGCGFSAQNQPKPKRHPK